MEPPGGPVELVEHDYRHQEKCVEALTALLPRKQRFTVNEATLAALVTDNWMSGATTLRR